MGKRQRLGLGNGALERWSVEGGGIVLPPALGGSAGRANAQRSTLSFHARHQRRLNRVAYLPRNAGSRFSRKARTPSLWSSVSPQRRWVIASRSSSVRKSAVTARLMFSFIQR